MRLEGTIIPGMSQVKLGLGLAVKINKTTTLAEGAKGGGRVFWSGGDDAMNAAMNYAKANRMTTLEMTRAGQNLTKLTQGMPWEQAAPM